TEAAKETTAAAATEAAKEGETQAAAPETAATTWEPTTTVSIVLPAGAGGDTDLTARVFAEYAKKLTGHDFIVVNASGAAGSVAANQVLAAAPDGHTFLYGHNLVNVANIAGVTDYNYTAFKLGPTFAKNPAQQLYVNPSKYADLNAFIEAAKAAPGQLKACTEVGAYTYYEILAFEKAAGIDLDLVDVGSNSDKIAAMLSEQVDLMPGAYLNCKDYLTAGQFACLGAPTEERYDLIKDIPTFKEQGIDLVYPDCDYSFYFPKETPDEVIVWYDNLVQQILADPAAQQAISDITVMPYYLSSADSEKHDEEIYNTIKGIADSLEQ
ncbi:MAG: tripartite tricarboxylate transporter substrate-binding protein, partial [Lachnospiraceae bacterium]|nr:tripartite tricarboxylate transporter substrate-binding protein [Lachnospiraceae bacterium]